MTTTHTPAPWQVEADERYGWFYLNHKISTWRDVDTLDATMEANRVLIEVAPELLTALLNMLASADAGDLDSLANAAEEARVVLAKALPVAVV